MIYKKGFRSGFTLVELLVVISIIGVLSSVVFASISSARVRARNATIKSSVLQLSRLLELEFDEKGTYAGLQTQSLGNGWFGGGASGITCANFPGSSSFKSQAIKICDVIVANGQPGFWGTLHLGVSDGDYTKHYSIMVGLADGGSKFYCYGSSGASEMTYVNNWNSPGCWSNP